ncbi:M1 family aminopeptidase, partial [Longimicrobium sp.]|uniref:M1 family aminopeptidase n=1 Tax=Longimicrobium sp. TaxID=2029185 RepID=UPI002E2F8372
PEALRRLEAAARADTPVHVVAAGDAEAGRATLRPADGRLTWRFHADSVRDFAFAASPRYAWDAVAARVPDGAGGTRAVPVHALYRPGIAAWDDGAVFARQAVEALGASLVPYPYPQLTVAEGPLAGGMEYPQLVFVGGYGDAPGLHAGIAHEVAHQWFPILVGQDEAAHAWMDEGMATWLAAGVRDPRMSAPDPLAADPLAADRRAYGAVAGTEREVPVVRHTDLVSPYGARAVAAYAKPGLLLRALRAEVGDTAWARALDTYLREWRFRRPTPWDFFHTVERAAGRDLDTFFYPWWWETGTADLAVERVERPGPGRVRVTVRDRGDIPIPAEVVVTTASGARARARNPARGWLDPPRRAATVELRVDGAPVLVELDPDGLFLDADRGNDRWTAAEGGAADGSPGPPPAPR